MGADQLQIQPDGMWLRINLGGPWQHDERALWPVLFSAHVGLFRTGAASQYDRLAAHRPCAAAIAALAESSGGPWRRPRLTVFQNRQPEAAAAIVVAIIEHVALALVIEDEGILDHL